MSKIAFRVDGGERIGFGHIIRSLVLANKLKKKNEVFFICIKDSKYNKGIDMIKKSNIRIRYLKGAKVIDEILSIQSEENAKCLITDSYDVDSRYFDVIKEKFNYSGYIDDVNRCRLNVDFIINQNINADKFNYNTWPNKNTKMFLGLNYVLLRDEFRKEFYKTINKNVEDILITVGASDENNYMIKLIETVKNIDVNFHIVVGPAFSESEKYILNEIAIKNKNVILHYDNDMCNLMESCDLAISSSGTTLYELCALRIPTISMPLAGNQKEICREFSSKNITIDGSCFMQNSFNEFYEIIDKVIEDSDMRMVLRNNQKNILNRNGVEVLVKEIEKIII